MGFKEEVERDFKYYEQLVETTANEVYFLFDKINEDEEETEIIGDALNECEKILRRMVIFVTYIKTLTEDEYFPTFSQDWHEFKCEMGDSLLNLDYLITEKEEKEE